MTQLTLLSNRLLNKKAIITTLGHKPFIGKIVGLDALWIAIERDNSIIVVPIYNVVMIEMEKKEWERG